MKQIIAFAIIVWAIAYIIIKDIFFNDEDD